MTIILYLVTVMNIGDTLGSRRQSRSLMRGWHKTCLLAASTLHISFILPPPAPVVTPGQARYTCPDPEYSFLSAASQASISLGLDNIPTPTHHKSYHQADMRSQIWPQRDVMVMTRLGTTYLMACQQLKFSCFQEKVLASIGSKGKTHLNGIF